MRLVVLTGASGSGKTTIAEAVASRRAEHVDVYYFDRVGVPPLEQMVGEYGSGEAWQRAMTFDWMSKLAALSRTRRKILFEGQMRLSFVSEGAAAAGISEYVLVLVDCDDATRTERLVLERGRSLLASPSMMNWAKLLRNEAERGGYPILNTSHLSLDFCIERVWEYLQ
jgi:hypothetical protein